MQPFAYGSKNFMGSVTYVQLCTTAIKITIFTAKWRWDLGSAALSPGKEKCDKLFH